MASDDNGMVVLMTHGIILSGFINRPALWCSFQRSMPCIVKDGMSVWMMMTACSSRVKSLLISGFSFGILRHVMMQYAKIGR